MMKIPKWTRKVVEQVNQYPEYESSSDSVTRRKLIVSLLVMTTVVGLFLGNLIVNLKTPPQMVETMQEKPTLDNIADYTCSCRRSVVSFSQFVTPTTSNMSAALCPTGYSLLYQNYGGEYYNWILCTTTAENFRSLLLFRTAFTPTFLHAEELQQLLLFQWYQSLLTTKNALTVSNEFQYTVLKTIYGVGVNHPTCQSSCFYNEWFSDANFNYGYVGQYVVDNMDWIRVRFSEEIVTDRSATFVPGTMSIDFQAYFDACGPVSCSRIKQLTTREIFFNAVSFGGGLLSPIVFAGLVLLTLANYIWHSDKSEKQKVHAADLPTGMKGEYHSNPLNNQESELTNMESETDLNGTHFMN